MKIIIKERKKENLIYLIDEVSLSPLTVNIISKVETKNFVIDLLKSNTHITKVETISMVNYDLF
jgi:hypothetical protein